MAINLWAAAGKPTAYSPLPAGWGTHSQINVYSKITISFFAKSASSARLTLTSNLTGYTNINLTNELKKYQLDINPQVNSDGKIYLYDTNSTGDIIIENITLTEKPIPPIRKPKKNLLPPFSQWTLHANAKVVAPYELELNITGANQISEFKVPTVGGITYSFNAEETQGLDNFIQAIDSNGVNLLTLLAPIDSVPKTFTTPAGTKFLRVTTNYVTTGKFTFKNPMLTEGTTAQPFEPFVPVNARAVNGVPRKNMIPISSTDISVDGSANAAAFDVTKGIVQGAEYALRGLFSIFADDTTTNDRISLALHYTDGTISTTSNGNNNQIRDGVERSVTVKATADPSKILTKIKVWPFDYSAAGTKMHRTVRELQLEKGTTATPFEPYREVNKRAGLVPAKNLFRGERTQDNTRVNEGAGATIIENVWDNGKLKVANGSSNTQGRGQSIPVKIGKTYTLRAKASNAIFGCA